MQALSQLSYTPLTQTNCLRLWKENALFKRDCDYRQIFRRLANGG